MPTALCGIADEATRQALLDGGCLVFEEPTHAVEVLAAKATWAAHRIEVQPPQPAPLEVAPSVLNEAEA